MSDLMKRLSAEWALKQLLAYMEDNSEESAEVQVNMAYRWIRSLLAFGEPETILDDEDAA